MLLVLIQSGYRADTPSFTLRQFLSRQRSMLHGYQARKLKHIPKVRMNICVLFVSKAPLSTDSLHCLRETTQSCQKVSTNTHSK